jgi:GNAT superfamily N-acetyltransferase
LGQFFLERGDVGTITLDVVKDGDIEPCRELCNELMAFQKSKAKLLPEVFDQMSFDTRMKPSLEQAVASQVVIARDVAPIGYIFSTIESVSYKDAHIPDWALGLSSGEALGFYPNQGDLPEKTGCINNLYIRDGYKGMGLGGRLMDVSMEWLGSFADIDLVFVYISNGNDGALDFYKKRGFAHSHEVFGGFIHALCKRL